ncbi:hypothetical protein [Actinomadura sp. SCN-SB]|uniref:hypothetical protein n=1 Tax=Actinomadura sp. SCN-SB TaxID=3373092 RepID=UPI003750060A
MEYADNIVTEATREALARVTRDREGLHQLLDYYLDFYFERPEPLRLWLHRSLSDAADFTDIEERYSSPLNEIIEEAFKDTDLLDQTDEYRMTTSEPFSLAPVEVVDPA